MRKEKLKLLQVRARQNTAATGVVRLHWSRRGTHEIDRWHRAWRPTESWGCNTMSLHYNLRHCTHCCVKQFNI